MIRTTLRKARRGNVATMFVMMTPAAMGSVAMGVDWGAVAVARYQVQAAADAAAMAGTTSMDDETVASTRAAAYVSRVRVNDITPTLTSLSIGTWDADTRMFTEGGEAPNAVRARTSATVPMYFSALFGISEVTVTGEAGAGPKVIPNRAPDTVIVLDVTPSMSPQEIVSEREATEALLDCVYSRSTPESRASIVLFGGVDYVQIDMVDYGGNYDSLLDAAANIRGCSNSTTPCSNTNPASGYEAALNILANANTPDDVGQAILLMSDGEPVAYQSICSNGFLRRYDEGEFLFPLRERCEAIPRDRRGNQTITGSTLNQWARTAQASATAAEIDTYTVYYGPNNSNGEAFLDDNVRANRGTHHVALTRNQIADTFVDICVEYTGGSAGLLF